MGLADSHSSYRFSESQRNKAENDREEHLTPSFVLCSLQGRVCSHASTPTHLHTPAHTPHKHTAQKLFYLSGSRSSCANQVDSASVFLIGGICDLSGVYPSVSHSPNALLIKESGGATVSEFRAHWQHRAPFWAPLPMSTDNRILRNEYRRPGQEGQANKDQTGDLEVGMDKEMKVHSSMYSSLWGAFLQGCEKAPVSRQYKFMESLSCWYLGYYLAKGVHTVTCTICYCV